MASPTTLLIFLAIVGVTYGSTTIEFLLDEADQPGDGDIFIVDTPQALSFIRRTRKVCVNGMWGLYDSIDYGKTDAEGSNVVALRGGSRFDCTNVTIAETMENVHSFRRLGHPIVTTESLEFYMLSNFRFNATLPIGTTPSKLTEAQAKLVKSFVLTGTSYRWRVCNGTLAAPGHCVCLDLVLNGPFLVPNLNSFPPNAPLGTIGVFEITTQAVCDTLESPIGDAPQVPQHKLVNMAVS